MEAALARQERTWQQREGRLVVITREEGFEESSGRSAPRRHLLAPLAQEGKATG
jgi:hypothetical protein